MPVFSARAQDMWNKNKSSMLYHIGISDASNPYQENGYYFEFLKLLIMQIANCNNTYPVHLYLTCLSMTISEHLLFTEQ